MKKLAYLPFLFLGTVFLVSFSTLPKAKTVVVDAPKVSHSVFNTLLNKNVTTSGVVNYAGFKENTEFENYLKALSTAQPKNSNWSKNEKLAYWINVYNAYTIKLINTNWPVKSIKDINDPWGHKFFSIGGEKTSLNDVEHEILRKMGEPRIHFAIVCASYSCPKLLNAAYTADKLESQLTAQTKSFLADTKRNKISASKGELSEIFNWFKSDFTANGTLIDFINKYSATKLNANATISHLPYNWDLNNK